MNSPSLVKDYDIHHYNLLYYIVLRSSWLRIDL